MTVTPTLEERKQEDNNKKALAAAQRWSKARMGGVGIDHPVPQDVRNESTAAKIKTGYGQETPDNTATHQSPSAASQYHTLTKNAIINPTTDATLTHTHLINHRP
jgi:hypothetical protein